ncbi:MAG: DUF2029 domain-containing protein [Gemmatimonadaceae bacterium]|nr:DUF2029 domain-containing protein [Gemmatimonadaceae bacterium]
MYGTLTLYVVATLAVTIQRGILAYPNDYAIFRWSSRNLVAGRDMYVLHPGQAHDLFKYSPSFAFLFAPFAVVPFPVGVILWNLTNALALYFAMEKLLPRPAARLAQLLVLPQVLRAAQSTQSNALVAALVILAFLALESGAHLRAAAAIATSAAIKVFPLAALALAVPREGHRPSRLARFIAIAVLVGAAIAAAPLVVVRSTELAAQYRSWAALGAREAHSYGVSALGLLHDWAGVGASPAHLQLAGTLALLLPLLRREQWQDRSFRCRFLASLLVYMVLFNHKAEQQSYVIALAGIAIWYTIEPRTPLRTAMMAVVFFMTSVSSSDIVPHAFREGLSALHRQAWPVALVWLLMQAQLLTGVGAGERQHGVACDETRHPRSPETEAHP